MSIPVIWKSVLLFAIAGLLEIGGGYPVIMYWPRAAAG